MQSISSTVNQEALLAELDLHKNEYGALRAEILQNLEAGRQYLNMSLVAVGAILAISPFILNQRAYVSLLLFPVIFHVILWEMIASSRMVSQLSEYLVDYLIPRVNAILDELGDNSRNATIFGWEVQVKKRLLGAPDRALAFFAPSQQWVPILAIAGLIIFYIIVTNTYQYSPSIGEILLIFLNLIFLILAAIRNLVLGRYAASQQPHKLQEQNKTKIQPSNRKQAVNKPNEES